MDLNALRLSAADRVPHPVFRGLEDCKMSGKYVAAAVGVTQPTYSKWRSGQSRVPMEILVFLTLLLASRLDELEDVYKKGIKGTATGPRFEAHLKSVRLSLYHQETFNAALPPKIVRDGARLFRQWWLAESGADETAETDGGVAREYAALWRSAGRARRRAS